MPDATPRDVVAYYDRHFREGMLDLSASSSPPIAIRIPESLDLEHSSARSHRALRAAIAARYATLSENDILVTAGASEALVALAHTLLRAGDVALTAPGAYPSFVAASRRLGAEVARPCATAGTARVLLINNPTVPAGRRVDMRGAIRGTESRGTTVIADEVYRELSLHEPITAAADLSPSAVSVGDISKPLGLGGLRIGWIASRDSALLERAFAELQLLSAGPSSLSAAVALAALNDMDRHLTVIRERVAQALPALLGALTAAGWSFELPDAGLTFAPTPPRPFPAERFAALREAGLFLLPGEVLGAPGAIRLSLLAPPAAIESALAILGGTS